MHGPVLKDVWVSAHARNHVIQKGAVNVLLQSYLLTSIYCSGLIYGHFEQHLYCACAETVTLNFWCKLWHRRSILLLLFPVRVQNFGDLATFPLIFFGILYAECQPYFYCRFVWPTDLESIPHYHTRPLLRRFVWWYVTWRWPFIFWPWSVLIHGGARVQTCHQVWRPYAYSFLSYEL